MTSRDRKIFIWILTTWDHREKRRDCRLSALSCDGMSQTDPRLSSELLPLGQLCVLVIATFSPDSWSLQFSSTFWKFLSSLLCKMFCRQNVLKSFLLEFFFHFLLHDFYANVCEALTRFSLVTLQQTFFLLYWRKIAGAKQFILIKALSDETLWTTAS